LTRLRLLFSISILALIATGLVACGSSGGGGGEDPNKVLDQTFSGDHAKVKSGDIDIKFNVDVSGKQATSVNAELSGPYENQGNKKVPKLDWKISADASGSGQNFNFDGGLISTGDAAYVNYKGSDYQVTPALFDKFKQQLEQSAGQSSQTPQSGKQLLQLLGVKDAKDLLTNLSNDGTADVDGTQTNHISGDVNVNKLIDSVKNLASGASALGALGGSSSQIPSGAQLDQIKSAIKTAHFDLYSGQDDNILRRLTLDIGVEPPSSSGVDKLDLNFDITLGKVNEPQTISAPSNAKPLADLFKQLGVNPSQLGSLGALGLGASGGGSATAPGSPSVQIPGGGGASSAQTQKYLDCISKGSSAADLQACNSLLPSG
jgi:hypothetical protein